MPEYSVTIEEISHKTYHVVADSEEAANEMAISMYVADDDTDLVDTEAFPADVVNVEEITT